MNQPELSQMKISDIVSENIRTANIFKKYGIDFCCGGGVTIEKACEKKNISAEKIYEDLCHIDETILPSQNYNNWELDFLADYIINTHHHYVSESLAILKEYATKVLKVHGESHPPLTRIYELFHLMANELWSHMQKEEIILFPYIKNLVHSKRSKEPITPPHFTTVRNPVNMMKQEHETAGSLMKEIAVLTNNYTPPDYACNTFKALYEKFNEFEQDLHIHVHLENNILFPKSIRMESDLYN